MSATSSHSALAALALTVLAGAAPSPAGEWRAVLDLAGGTLPFTLVVRGSEQSLRAELCNGRSCQPVTRVRRVAGDSLAFEMADFAATITARLAGDSLTGSYHNVGNRGPRTIPFRAARGRWPSEAGPAALLGSWDATFFGDWGTSPRVFRFSNGPRGLEGTVLSNTGDYGDFWGRVGGDSFALAHFDGSFVYLVTGRLDGDTLRGIFHAGPRTETPWKAVRSTGAPHLADPATLTRADSSAPFHFAFPDLSGRVVSNHDPRFRGKVVLVDVFGTWCPTCHEEAPTLVDLYRRYHASGLEIVGLAYEVSGDSSTDAPLVRRYREKFGIPFPLLLAGTNDVDAAAATLPQLTNFTSFPTAIFIGRDGRVRRVHAGFYGPAAGARHAAQVAGFRREIAALLAER